MKLDNQDFLLDKIKKELEETIKQSMRIVTFIAIALMILTMISNGILYYNIFLIPFYKSFGEQSTEISFERRISTIKISTDLFFHITNFIFFYHCNHIQYNNVSLLHSFDTKST
jgi:hypothetical protein